MSFNASCVLSSPDSLRVLQWNAGGLQARSTELLHFLQSHPVDLICIQKSNLNSSSSFRIPGFSALRSDCTHSLSGILSLDAKDASGGVVIFVRQGLSFSELSTSILLSLHPYSDYVEINISLNNYSSVSFLNVYAPPICLSPTNSRTNSFSSSIFLSSRNLFILGDFNGHHPQWDSRGTSDPCGKYLTASFFLTSSPLMTSTHPPFYHAPLAVAPLLTFPLLTPLLPFLAPGRCFRTWFLTTYQFFYPSLFPVYRPNERPPSFNFQKARWDDFASHFDFHCPSAEEYSFLFLSSAATLFISLTLNAAKSSIPFGCIKRTFKVWWSAEVEDAVGERCKAFAAAHRSDEVRQAYISAYRRASSVIAKAKAEAWQTTCSSISHKSNPKSVHSLLRSIAGSPSSSSSSPSFPNCSSPRKTASIYAAYLISHFSVSQPKALRSRARGYLSELRQATCPV